MVKTIYLQEKQYLCQFVQAPGSPPLSHHSRLPLHCHGRKSRKMIEPIL